MMDFDEEPIDRAEQALKLLVEQYRGSDRIQGLIRAVADRLTEVDEARVQTWTRRWLGTAEGAQLDGLGEILGATRQGRDDDEYRLRLQAQVTINTGSGTPEDLISGVSLLTGANQVQVREKYPAAYELFINVTSLPADLRSLIATLSPAGVAATFLIVTDDAEPFGFDNDPQAEGFNELGDDSGGAFSELLNG